MSISTNLPRLKGFRHPRAIIAYTVWAYHRLALSAADVEDLAIPHWLDVQVSAIKALGQLGAAVAIDDILAARGDEQGQVWTAPFSLPSQPWATWVPSDFWTLRKAIV